MRAATIVFIKDITKMTTYNKFIYFEMIESVLEIKLNIIIYIHLNRTNGNN